MIAENTRISTARLFLVPVSEKYAENIFNEFTEQITTYMYPKAPANIGETLEFIRSSKKQLQKGESLNVTIILANTGEFIGGAGISHIDTRTPELGVWIKTSAHGHKYGQEAVHGLKDWAHKHLKYDYLRYPVDKRNLASRKIAESLGGIQKKEFVKTNQSGIDLDEVEYWIYRD